MPASALLRESASEENGARNKRKAKPKNKNKEEGLGAEGDVQAFEIRVGPNSVNISSKKQPKETKTAVRHRACTVLELSLIHI